MEIRLGTAKEVIKYLQISTTTLKRLEESGELVPHMKLPSNGKRFYKWEDVYAYANTTLTGEDNVYKVVREDE